MYSPARAPTCGGRPSAPLWSCYWAASKRTPSKRLFTEPELRCIRLRVMIHHMVRAIVAFAFAASLGACAAPPDVRDQLVGADVQRVSSCMGEPAHKQS